MRATSPASPVLPAIRLRISCPNLAEYRAGEEATHDERGVFISSGRGTSRPIGSRVFLRIELADRTLGYAGPAVVTSHVTEGDRTGCVLTLDRSAAEGGEELTPDDVTVEVELPAPEEAPPPATSRAADTAPRASVEAPPPAPERHGPSPADSVTAPILTPARSRHVPLSEAIFSDDEERVPAPAQPVAAAVEVEVEEVEAEPAGTVEAMPGDDAPAPVVVLREVPLRLQPTPVPARTPLPAAPSADARSRPRARRALLVGGAAAAIAVLAAASAAAGVGAARARQREAAQAAALEASFAAAIRDADDRLQAGRLSAPAGDSAVDHLLRARALRPADGRVVSRLELLAATFERLGRRAEERGDLQEAVAHLAGALRADPGRDSLRADLERLDARRRADDGKRRRTAQRGTARPR